EEVIGEANARGDGAIVGIPQSADGTAGRRQRRAIAYLVEEGGAAAEVKVGVERLNVVVLHAVVLIAESEVEGESRRDAPAIFEICSPVVEAEAACKARLSGGQSQCASGSLYHVPQYISAARKLALRIDGHLEQRQPSSDQVVERGGSVVAKLFD